MRSFKFTMWGMGLLLTVAVACSAAAEQTQVETSLPRNPAGPVLSSQESMWDTVEDCASDIPDNIEAFGYEGRTNSARSATKYLFTNNYDWSRQIEQLCERVIALSQYPLPIQIAVQEATNTQLQCVIDAWRFDGEIERCAPGLFPNPSPEM